MVHTEPRYTKDLDLWIEPVESNAQKLLVALAEFGAPTKEIHSSDFTEPEVFFQIGIEPVRIDIMTSVSGLEFVPAWDRKVIVDFGGRGGPGTLPRGRAEIKNRRWEDSRSPRCPEANPAHVTTPFCYCQRARRCLAPAGRSGRIPSVGRNLVCTSPPDPSAGSRANSQPSQRPADPLPGRSYLLSLLIPSGRAARNHAELSAVAIRGLLLADVLANLLQFEPDRGNGIASSPEMRTREIPFLAAQPGNRNGALPLEKPDDRSHRVLWGIAMHICTWSGIKCPSRIWHSFCRANPWKIWPR